MSFRGRSFGGFVFLGLIAAVPAQARPLHQAIRAAAASPTAACTFPDGSTPPGDRNDAHCYTPNDFFAAYGIDKLHALGLIGEGQTIILADSYGTPTAQADLDHFSDVFGLPRTTIQFIYPNGPYTNPLTTADQVGWAEETSLDLQWAHAIAPGATIVNIVTDSDETVGVNGMGDLFNGFQQAITKYPGAILSMSFGTGESTFAAADVRASVQGTFHAVFQAAANAGFSILGGAGDSGSDNMSSDNATLSSTPDAFYPASDPLVTAVGGTAMESGWLWTPQGTIDDYWTCELTPTTACPTNFLAYVEAPGSIRESVWNEQWAPAAGGGGISKIFGVPAFQTSLDVQSQPAAKGQRTLPDMAMNAAINGGVEVYTGYTSAANGVQPAWNVVGGTSCATPETAALVALAGQQASQLVGHAISIGELNPQLYALNAADFNDIVTQTYGTAPDLVTIGDNALFYSATALQIAGPGRVPPVAVPGYPTTVGYDMASGRGSPVAPGFVLDLAAARAAQEIITKP